MLARAWAGHPTSGVCVCLEETSVDLVLEERRVITASPPQAQSPAPADIVFITSSKAFIKRPISSSVPIDTLR